MARLRVAEVFTSVQGEGRWLGTPSTFVRVSGCNLRCVWCDTPYASWRPEGPVVEVEDVVRQVSERGVRHVVVTGGEPMLFPSVEPLTGRLRELGHVITIETAGTVFRPVTCDLMSISPKLANSTPEGRWREPHERRRKDLDPLRRLVAEYDVQLKVVLDPEGGTNDVAELEALLADLPPLPPDAVMVMAEGRDSETLHRRERLLVPIVMARGWRLTPRFQIDLFGDTRGT